MNVLSLFDGMSCGQLALQRARIKVNNYFASEIDKYAIQIAGKNFPNTIHIGDIQNWKNWNLPKIDILIGGSPCQGFSQAGVGLNFEDPRSKLFFTYVDILNELKSKNPELKFLLENVKMKREWRDIITNFIGVESVEINSALVSAQNRKRLYWANWEFPQPQDKGIVLLDIIENKQEGSDASNVKTIPHGYIKENVKTVDKYPSLCAQDPSSKHLIFVGGLEKGRRLRDGKNFSRNFREGSRIYSMSGKAATLSAQPKGGDGGYTGLYQVGMASDIKGFDVVRRIYSEEGKSPALTSMQGGQRQPKIRTKSKTVRVGGKNSPRESRQEWDLISKEDYRRLSVVECERLQTLPDNYTDGVSNTQRYKMIGNGWTVDVISHIFSFMPQ